MNDKEWLDKLIMAKKVYGASVEVDDFVKWVFKQYGMAYPVPKDPNILIKEQ